MGLKATSAEVYHAHTHALNMYVRLLGCAADACISAVAGLVQLAESVAAVGLSAPVTEQHALPILSVAQPILPADFDRFCAAILSWAPNLASLNNLVFSHVMMLATPEMVGDAGMLLPWLPGGEWKWNDTWGYTTDNR
jgi:hypothetical protein